MSNRSKNAILGSIVHSVKFGELEIIDSGLIVFSHNGVIEEVIDLAKTPKSREYLASFGTLLDYSGKLIVPGFVDAHCHAPQYVFTGTGMDLPLLAWLEKYTFPCEARFKDTDFARLAYTKSIQRHLKCGTTFASYFATIHNEAGKVLVDVINNVGQRAFVGKVSMDRNCPDFYIEQTSTGCDDAEEFVQYVLSQTATGREFLRSIGSAVMGEVMTKRPRIGTTTLMEEVAMPVASVQDRRLRAVSNDFSFGGGLMAVSSDDHEAGGGGGGGRGVILIDDEPVSGGGSRGGLMMMPSIQTTFASNLKTALANVIPFSPVSARASNHKTNGSSNGGGGGGGAVSGSRFDFASVVVGSGSGSGPSTTPSGVTSVKSLSQGSLHKAPSDVAVSRRNGSGNAFAVGATLLNRTNTPLVMPCVTPRFVPTCTPEMMSRLGELSARYGLPVQSHLSESQGEIEWVHALHPDCDTYAAVYDKYGLLHENVYMAHCCHSSREERALLAARGCGVVHCASSNFMLSSGVMDVRVFLSEGVKVALGTDVAGGYSPSMLDALRQCVVASRVKGFDHRREEQQQHQSRSGAAATSTPTTAAGDSDSDCDMGQPRDSSSSSTTSDSTASCTDQQQQQLLPYKSLNYAEAFHLATVGGAEVLGMADVIGNFLVGKKLDCLVVDVKCHDSPIDTFEGESVLDHFEKFLFNGDDRNIVHVIVDGRMVI